MGKKAIRSKREARKRWGKRAQRKGRICVSEKPSSQAMVLYDEEESHSKKRTLRLPNKPTPLVLLILIVVLALVVAALLPTILILLRDLLA